MTEPPQGPGDPHGVLAVPICPHASVVRKKTCPVANDGALSPRAGWGLGSPRALPLWARNFLSTAGALDPQAPSPGEAGFLAAAPGVVLWAAVGGAPGPRGRVGRLSLGGKIGPCTHTPGCWEKHLLPKSHGVKEDPGAQSHSWAAGDRSRGPAGPFRRRLRC